eukprot:TRINITY_DN15920_c0_g1_i1.p2 TRINITY_DN15920_c0_g1~~TRINITY_DN15920_c0_g1_i1.p2  ORF type:complete len:125 (-),score=15.85 TRINITY_DN15920_c0_g1_i1:188-562(-)
MSTDTFFRHAPAVGTHFCPHCGNLLELPGLSNVITCQLCKYSCDGTEFAGQTVVTKSRPKRKDPWDVLEEQTSNQSNEATVDEECPKCGNIGMSFHTAQLRSADEGQTIFYTCLSCRHKFSVNS